MCDPKLVNAHEFLHTSVKFELNHMVEGICF